MIRVVRVQEEETVSWKLREDVSHRETNWSRVLNTAEKTIKIGIDHTETELKYIGKCGENIFTRVERKEG